MYKITENDFYNICDLTENVTGSVFPYDYMPTINELMLLEVEEHLDIHLPYLIYLSNDPFKTKESADLAKYIKDLLNKHLEVI